MVKKAIILDVAHGKDVKGKASPDGIFREWEWSRQTARRLMTRIIAKNPKYSVICPYLSYRDEPGLLTRVKKYNDICKGYHETIVLSIHNNAAPKNLCDKDGWNDKIRGIEFYTPRGETKADEYCTLLYNRFKKNMPNEKYRTGYWLGKGEKIKDPDKEANFIVIAGHGDVKPKYFGILLEIKFMTSHADVEDLTNYSWLKRFDLTMLKCMDEINKA